MSTQFFCKNRDRWKKISASTVINGIDYLEVFSADQKTLKLFFLNNLPGQTDGIPTSPVLTKENIFVEGGVRIKNIVVKNVTSSNEILTIELDGFGDFSTYTLMIGNSSTDKDTPPNGFDQQLSSLEFSFKIDCPNEFDCKTETICQPDNIEEPNLDYLAKDYGSFNRLMLDRLSSIMPGWNERHAADLQIALIELLAYVGDHLSYYQDAVATESYIHTARRRVSLKRHARLLDYYVHDGCNARTWVHIEVDKNGSAENLTLEKGTILMTSGTDDRISIKSVDKEKFINERDPVVFETMHKIVLHADLNMISFYTWEDSDCCLQKGTTRATLLDLPLQSPPQYLPLIKGDVLIFEELYSPDKGKKADANPKNRHAVRLKKVERDIDKLTSTNIINVEWYEEDALPFSVCLTSSIENEDNQIQLNEKSVARGNIVLADHGSTFKMKRLKPVYILADENYYPELPGANNTVTENYNHEVGKFSAAKLSINQNPHNALPVVSLFDGQESWTTKQDLLGSDRFATEFVVEMEQDGRSFLRFGNDKSGKKPLTGFSPRATYRTGNGKSGNIGAESINTIVCDTSGITKVRNPMTAAGGRNAETMEEIRQFAPQAFRTQERAVTAADYVEKTELHPEVQKAAAKFYWTGSWYTVYIIIDRKEGKEIDSEFKKTIRKHLEQYRMAGYDLEIRQPQFVPLNLILNVCVKDGYFKSEVKKSLLLAFCSYALSDGSNGFFHPDNFTFGQAVYLSAIYQRAMEIDGVASVEIKVFNRWAKKSNKEIQDGVLIPADLEIIRLDNNPSLPENGKIDFIMLGGL